MLPTKSLRTILPMALAVFALLAYSFIGAEWNPAPANPPNQNAPAPINVGEDITSAQSGQGSLTFDFLSARDTVLANVEMRSPKYCDLNGQNCFPSTIDEPETQLTSGGTYTKADDGNCTQINPVTGGCFCGEGYTERYIGSGNICYGTREIRNSQGSEGTVCTGSSGTKTYSCILSGSVYSTLSNRVDVYAQVRKYHAVIDPAQGIISGSVERELVCDYFKPGSVPELYTVTAPIYRPARYNGVSSKWENMPEGTKLPVLETLTCVERPSYALSECQVDFSWNINGSSGNVTKNVIGIQNRALALAMHYDKDDWESSSARLQFFTESLDGNSWGGSWRDSSERAVVGYIDPLRWLANRDTYTVLDASSNVVIKGLLFKNGSTLNIQNDAVSDIPAGTIKLSAEIKNCSLVD